MKWVLAGLTILSTATAFAGEESTIYGPDPQHLWNRLNETLFLRTAPDGKQFGLDELDILYWFTTKHLLAGPSRQKALAVLDEFISAHVERLVQDPLKRAWLQRDLWELFDWSAKVSPNPAQARARRELLSRLVVVIRRVALTTNEIASLPDNYLQSSTANLPRGLFLTNGDWLIVHDLNNPLTAPTHVSSFDGHSGFTVHLRVPGGRAAAGEYLERLQAFARTNHLWVYRTNNFMWANTNEPNETLELNPALPQFPTNTEWALVRRMLLIDTNGNLRPTRVVESIQMRRYLSIKPPVYVTVTNDNGYAVPVQVPQNFYEFQFNRRGGGRLREIANQERGFAFVHFFSKGIDLFELSSRFGASRQPGHDSSRVQAVLLKTCAECHSGPGIYSVSSYTRSLSFSLSPQRPAALAEDTAYRDMNEAIAWKERDYGWGLLQGLWMNGR
jgi:hypothetical protein